MRPGAHGGSAYIAEPAAARLLAGEDRAEDARPSTRSALARCRDGRMSYTDLGKAPRASIDVRRAPAASGGSSSAA